jgi:hypothetical protein
MVEIVDDFFKFLGPELKAVTGAASLAVLLHAFDQQDRVRVGCPST